MPTAIRWHSARSRSSRPAAPVSVPRAARPPRAPVVRANLGHRERVRAAAAVAGARGDLLAQAADAHRAAPRPFRPRRSGRALAVPAAARAGRPAGGTAGPRSTSPAAGPCRSSRTCTAWTTARSYTNVQMPWPDLPPHPPAANPTGVYERDVEVPAAWSGRRVVLHVGAAESVLVAAGERRRGGDQQGLPPGRGARRHRRRPARRDEHGAPDRGEVVRRVLHRGPGPVVARRDHPAGVPLRDRADVPGGRPGPRGRSG